MLFRALAHILVRGYRYLSREASLSRRFKTHLTSNNCTFSISLLDKVQQFYRYYLLTRRSKREKGGEGGKGNACSGTSSQHDRFTNQRDCNSTTTHSPYILTLAIYPGLRRWSSQKSNSPNFCIIPNIKMTEQDFLNSLQDLTGMVAVVTGYVHVLR